LNVSNTSPLTVTTTYPGFDTVLLGEGLIDKLLSVKIGTNAVVQLATGTAANNSTGYNLGGGVLTTNQSYTAEVVLQGVALQDAYDLKNQIDGVPVTSGTLTNLTGRVEFAGTGNPTTVYVYLTGR